MVLKLRTLFEDFVRVICFCSGQLLPDNPAFRRSGRNPNRDNGNSINPHDGTLTVRDGRVCQCCRDRECVASDSKSARSI